jgi:hypothetical protein
MKFLLLAIPFLAAAQQGAVEGAAFNQFTKAPVPGVRVRMTSYSEPGRNYEAVTGLDGRYRLANLPPGDYHPNVTAPEGLYGPPIRDIVFTRVPVSDGVTTYDIPINPPATVRGRVLDADRHPAARARITAIPADDVLPGMASTDSNGLFSLKLAPGKYRLRVQPASGSWAPTYYPSAADPSTAEVISVGGAGLDGLDIRLRPAATNRLTGIVRDDTGKPAAGVELSLSGNDMLLSSGPKATSDSKGAFEFTAVPCGNWLILGGASRDGARWLGTSTVTMPDRDYDGAEVRIHPPFALEVEIEGLPADRRVPVSPDLRPVAGFTLPYAQEKDGVHVFERVYPGAYRIGVRGIVFGRYLKAILLGAADVTGQQVDLGPASPPIRFVYAPNGGHMSGEVENGAGAKVVLMWADRDNYIPGAESMTITCNDTGRFTTPDLRPGAWYAIAFPPSMRGQPADVLRNRLFDRGLWREAASIRIAEGETADVKLKITPWID